MRRAAIFVLACGCHRLWAIDPVADAGPDAVADAPDAPLDTLPACPDDYLIEFPAASTSKYRFFAQTVPWADAAEACANAAPGRTHLVVIESETERAAINDTFVTNLTGVWLGLSDLVNEGTFLWVTAQPTPMLIDGLLPWAINKPDGDTDQNCGRINPSSNPPESFDDSICTDSYYFLCECDDWADDPDRY